jgi:hypothetical protein
LFDDLFRSVNAVHLGHISKSHQKSHPGTIAAAKVNAFHTRADAGFFRKVHRRNKTADVNLLSHYQLPELPFGAAVNSLNFL